MTASKTEVGDVLRKLIESRVGSSNVDESRLRGQVEIAEEIRKLLEDGGGIVLEAPTGYGKTEVVFAPYVAAQLSGYPLVDRLIHVTPIRSLLRALFLRYLKYAWHLQQTYNLRLLVGYDHGDIWFRLPEIVLGVRRQGLTANTLHNFMARKLAEIRQLVERAENGDKKSLLELRKLLGHNYMTFNINIATFDVFAYGLLSQRTYGDYMLLPLNFASSSLVVFDEVHLLQDSYMYTFTVAKEIISYLVDAGIPVVVMTATMPEALEKKFKDGGFKVINASAKTPYPIDVETRWELKAEKLTLDSLKRLVREAEGSIKHWPPDILIVVNTVKKARELYQRLQHFSFDEEEYEVLLAHSMLTDKDRVERESLFEVLSKAKRANKSPKPLLAIATQVAECGLDYPFDIVITELAPIDALIQRIGRIRREGKAYIIGLTDYSPYEKDIIDASLNAIKALENAISYAPRSLKHAKQLLNEVYTENVIEKLKEKGKALLEVELERFQYYFESLNLLRLPRIRVKLRPRTYIEVLPIDDNMIGNLAEKVSRHNVCSEAGKYQQDIMKGIMNGHTIRVELSPVNFGRKNGKYVFTGRVGSLLNLGGEAGGAYGLRVSFTHDGGSFSPSIYICQDDTVRPFEVYLLKKSNYDDRLGLLVR